MSILSSIRTVLDFLFRRRRAEREMAEDLRSHLRRRTDDLERQSLPRAEAECRHASSLARINVTRKSAVRRWERTYPSS